MKIGDIVRSKASGRLYVLDEHAGRAPFNRRYVLWGAKSLTNGAYNAFSSNEIEKV